MKYKSERGKVHDSFQTSVEMKCKRIN